jgi:hypothetical protein
MSDFGNVETLGSLTAPIVPVATYFHKSDCVEYLNEDTVAIHRRIDEFLTLIFDETRINLIGFKLKGFRCIYEKHLAPLQILRGVNFVELVPALEYICTVIGDAALEDPKKRHAYVAAMKLAKDVRLYDLAA